MKRFMAWVYECEHCGKRGRSASHMTQHERACTMNSDRLCGMCRLAGKQQASLTHLREIVRSYIPVEVEVPEGGTLPGLHVCPDDREYEMLCRLRSEAGECPSCVTAALRQENVWCMEWSHKAAAREWLDEVAADAAADDRW